MSARDQILRRLRAAGAGGHLPPSPARLSAAVPMPGPETGRAAAMPFMAPERAPSMDERVERFCAEAAALGIDCRVEASAGEVRARLADEVRGLAVLSWHAEHLPYDAMKVLGDPCLGDAPRPRQAAAEIGVTGCDAAIAETGSLVLFAGPGRSRAVSLLPPVHVALVRRSQISQTMAEMFAATRGAWPESAACTIITGPSRTADIELTLTLGIHGPGRVIVIIGP